MGDHQCCGTEGQQRFGGKSQQPDQDDRGEEQGLSEQETVHYHINFHLGGLDLYPEGVNR